MNWYFLFQLLAWFASLGLGSYAVTNALWSKHRVIAVPAVYALAIIASTNPLVEIVYHFTDGGVFTKTTLWMMLWVANICAIGFGLILQIHWRVEKITKTDATITS